MIHDSNVTIQDLKNLLIEFRHERDWAKFHDVETDAGMQTTSGTVTDIANR
jgi:hypothetical protein